LSVADPTLAAELRGITKDFYGTLANGSVDLDLNAGEVHSLLGENGAGKSTLCSVLAGLYRPDGGDVIVGGQRQTFRSPRDALAAGVGMVYQQFRLVNRFTVAENLVLGHPEARFRVSSRRIERDAQDLCESYGLAVDPTARVFQLSVGEQQRVEILKLLYRGVRILILDEPTAVLTPQESEALFVTVRKLRDEGHTVVFVSHKLREVLGVSDRITVLRHGRRVGQLDVGEADATTLARMMMGKDIDRPAFDGPRPPAGAPLLKVSALHVTGDRGNEVVRGLDLEVAPGRIEGIAGVAGNGQREMTEAIAGLRAVTSGTVTLDARDVTRASVIDRIRAGLGFVPEDRLGQGVAGGLPLEDNLALKAYRDPPISRGPLLSSKELRRWARALRERFDIRGSLPGLPVRFLSGGNLQRAILAREISARPKVLLAASPTRGLDIGATDGVRRTLIQQRAEGTAILLVSEDLDELMLLSDRIHVIYEGRFVAAIPSGDFDRERIGLLMAGHLDDDGEGELAP